MIKYVFKSKKLFIINIFIVVMYSFLNTTFAFIIKDLVDVSLTKNLDKFLYILKFAVLYVISILILGYLRQIYFSKFIKFNLTALKNDIFAKLIKKNRKDFNSKNTANYISLINNDIEILKNGYFSNLLIAIEAVVSFIVAIVSIFKLNINMAIIIITLNIVPIIIPYLTGHKLATYKKAYSDNLSKLTTKSKDLFQGFEVIKSFNIQTKAINQFKDLNNLVESLRYRFSIVNALVSLLVQIFSKSAYFIVIVIGTYLIIKGQTTVGTFIAAIQLMDYISGPMSSITSIISIFKSVGLICKKITNILNKKDIVEEGIKKNTFEKSIEFKNVSFSYDEEKSVLKDISFNISKGHKYAVVGRSGSGKSTLIRLLLKYYDDFKGDILIDGVSNTSINSSSLYKLISVIQQEVFLFDTTIKNNITLYEDYNELEIEKALHMSGLYDFVNTLSEKTNSHVGENGCTLSGGEKQRIAVARAIIRNTPILALDEATASLDNQTSYNIESELLELKDITLIVITHKLSQEILKKYDEILVVNDGKLVEKGSFDELMSNKNYFYNMYSLEKKNNFKISNVI